MPAERRRAACVAAALGLAAALAAAEPSTLLPEVIDAGTLAGIAARVQRNETGGDESRLLWWNEGEHFLSLGIGHFIWYPADVDEPFRESFPALLRTLQDGGVALPGWLDPQVDCPWPDRAAWLAAVEAGDPRVAELRTLLESTLDAQAGQLVTRLRDDLATLFDDLPPLAAERLRERLRRVATAPGGLFALVDYVNFKGDGRHAGERYAGQGWGLLQVLAAMADEPGAAPLDAFADAAAAVLRLRVRNAPPERDEGRWLDGWLRRVDGYRVPGRAVPVGGLYTPEALARSATPAESPGMGR